MFQTCGYGDHEFMSTYKEMKLKYTKKITTENIKQVINVHI